MQSQQLGRSATIHISTGIECGSGLKTALAACCAAFQVHFAYTPFLDMQNITVIASKLVG